MTRRVRGDSLPSEAMDFLGVGVMGVDGSGAVRFANAEALAIMGWRNVSRFKLPSLVDIQPFLFVLEHCRQNPRHACQEFTFEKGTRIFKVFGRAYRDGQRGFMFVLADITAEKEAERVKTEFVALASHQLRTPLSIMKWMFERMARHGGGGKTKAADGYARWFKRVVDSNEQMIALVNDLLNVSRLEAGKLAPSPGDVDLRLLTGHVLGEFSAKIKEKKLSVASSVGVGPYTVFADTKFLHEILTNLVSNAVKYTPSHGRIKVAIARTPGNRIAWSIADTGVGIPAREQRQVFDKFFRGENVAGTEIEGTGLGLYVVRRMTEASGGTVRFRSVEGKGSTFTVFLPRADHAGRA